MIGTNGASSSSTPPTPAGSHLLDSGDHQNPAEPRGLTVDAGGNIWWADQTAGALRRLTPGTNQVATYNLPVNGTPNMVFAQSGKIYFTAYDYSLNVGTIGILSPTAIQGSSVTTATFNSVESCTFLGAGTPATVSTGSGTVSWTASTWTDITPSGAAAGGCTRVLGWMPSPTASYRLAAACGSRIRLR